MSKKCVAFSKSKIGLEIPNNRKAFYAGWDAALAEQAEQEPVAKYSDIVSDGGLDPRNAIPVRTKDLTDDEIVNLHSLDEFWDAHADDIFRYMDFARAVIAADREKNK